MRCNLCGSGTFVEVPGRGNVRCAACGSLERTRVTGLLIDAQVKPTAGARILHFAPELGLATKLSGIGGDNYRAVDIAPDSYSGLGVPVTRFDLCRDVFQLPRGGFDLIVHNHVLEHIECNYSVVLIRLLQALAPTGMMLFSTPLLDESFSDALIEGTRDEKRRRFGAALHVRQFGRPFLQQTLGMIFHLPPAYDLTGTIAPDVLEDANIARRHWRKWTGASVFCVGRRDLRV